MTSIMITFHESRSYNHNVGELIRSLMLISGSQHSCVGDPKYLPNFHAYLLKIMLNMNHGKRGLSTHSLEVFKFKYKTL